MNLLSGMWEALGKFLTALFFWWRREADKKEIRDNANERHKTDAEVAAMPDSELDDRLRKYRRKRL